MSIKSCNRCFAVENLKLCDRCKKTQYCSRRCQRTDWPLHKKQCKKIEAIAKEKIASQNSPK